MAVIDADSRLRARVVDAPGGPLTLFESADVERDLDDAIAQGGPAPYGRVLWSSAPCVAHVVAGMDLRGKRVLELGCGTGLVALVAARQGAAVLATDVDEGALAATARGAALIPDAQLETAIFDVKGAAPLPPADVVVAADVLYEELLAAALARRVLEARCRGDVVIVGDPGRVFRAAFSRLVAEGGEPVTFRAVTVPCDGGAHTADVLVLGAR